VFHSSPPKLRLRVMIHFGASRVDEILGCMGLIKDFLL
jgi:hypothetical protein